MKKLIQQPLLHFLLLGIALFLIFNYGAAKQGGLTGNKSIIIDRDSLLTFMQYRNQAFNQQYFSQQLDAMNEEERQNLINGLVREEALYREALAMHLEENDYVIRQRLIQKLEFLTQGFITARSGLTEADIKSYYAENKHEYYEQPSVTFTNVFFDYELHSPEQARTLAEKTQRELNDNKVSFSDGIQYGDRFLYYSNYVERTPDYVASHFGVDVADAIFRLTSDDSHWYGPFESQYGLHLIMLTATVPGRFPELAEIYERVKDNAEQAMVSRKTETAINDIINNYNVKVVLNDAE